MSARDAESGSSTYRGGSGRAGGLGNGGIGGGMGGGGNHGGGMGGGAGRNGGIGNQTGLTTGNRMIGGVAYGRPGGLARNPGAWGIAPTPPVTSRPLNRPAVPGLLNPAPVPGVTPVPEYVPQLPDMYYPPYTTPETVPGVPAPPSQYPISIQGPGWTGPTGYWQKNPTNYPQYARDWEKGMWGDDNYYRGMGVTQPEDAQPDSPGRGYGGWNTPGFN